MKLEPPFQAKTLQLLSLKIVKGKYDDPGSSYSKEIKSLLSALLQVDPKRRPKISDVLSRKS
jgi:serine/threonine protein kinase